MKKQRDWKVVDEKVLTVDRFFRLIAGVYLLVDVLLLGIGVGTKFLPLVIAVFIVATVVGGVFCEVHCSSMASCFVLFGDDQYISRHLQPNATKICEIYDALHDSHVLSDDSNILVILNYTVQHPDLDYKLATLANAYLPKLLECCESMHSLNESSDDACSARISAIVFESEKVFHKVYEDLCEPAMQKVNEGVQELEELYKADGFDV